MTELHYAAYCGDAEAAHACLEAGADPDARDEDGWTPLHWVLDVARLPGEREAIVAALLAAGASPTAVDRSGFSVVAAACRGGDLRLLSMVLDAGGEANGRDRDSTPLHYAAWRNFDEGVRLLLSRGADPAAIDRDGRTPEQVARECDFDRTMRVFATSRPPTHVVTKLPVVRLATARGDATRLGDADREVIGNLLRAGAVRFVVADVGVPLHWVPEADCFDMWKKEVRPHLAEPNQRVHLEQFPAHYAYFASRWDDGATTPIILLSKVH